MIKAQNCLFNNRHQGIRKVEHSTMAFYIYYLCLLTPLFFGIVTGSPVYVFNAQQEKNASDVKSVDCSDFKYSLKYTFVIGIWRARHQ